MRRATRLEKVGDVVSEAQWAVTCSVMLAAGLASYFYNDGRDRHLESVLRAAAVIGAIGTGLFFVGEALATPPSGVPECDWSNLDQDLRPDCETPGQASRRAAGEGASHFVSSYLVGPAIEMGATTVGAIAGFLVALTTTRHPTDGRARRVMVDEN